MAPQKKTGSIIPGTSLEQDDPPPSGSAVHLESAVQDHIGQYGQSQNTKKAYTRYTTGPTGAHKFLDDLLKERKRLGTKDHMPDEELAHALDEVPNQWSAYVLSLYIADKCVREVVGKKLCGKSTAETIYSAWVKLWTKSGYGDEYHLDKVTGKVTGCPAKSYEVKELIKSIKAREAKKAASAYRHHAEAMSIEGMKAIVLDYSEGVCPNTALENPPLSDVAALKILDLHGFMRAFMTTAFTLFSRNQETMNMKFGDLDLNAVGPAPRFRPFIRVIMGERKGWIKAAGNDGSTCQVFEIFEQPDHPEMDMYSHLRRWLNYLSLRLGRPLEPDDYLFPHIAPNGAIHIKQPFSYDTIAEVLEDFRKAAGLEKPFTTHCFRRGGSQYRFMYAPPDERWSLNAIQWWGGWVSGEGSVDVLTRYLVDSMHTLENTYQHMLDPDRARTIDRQAFTGSNRLNEPASQEDILDLQASLTREIRVFLSQMFAQVQLQVANATAQLYGDKAPLDSLSEQAPAPYSPSISCPEAYLDQQASCSRDSAAVPSTTFHSATGIAPPHQAAFPVTQSIPTLPIAKPTTSLARGAAFSNGSAKAGVQGMYIPNLHKGSNAWREAVSQWEAGGKDLLPLRDWPPEWYTGERRSVNGAKHGQRKLIAKEFDRLNRDEKLFLDTYPEAKLGISKLLVAIRAQQATRRRSKNGLPSERDARAQAAQQGDAASEEDSNSETDS